MMNKKKKVMLVFGTRPEAIKMAPLVHRLKTEPENFEVQVCVTAQHRQMLDQVLSIFQIVPDIDLDVMKPGQDLFDLTANVLQGMKGVFKVYKPDVVLVHGDTTTTLATAMAAFYAGVPLGHVEAGLRTYDLSAPFPEEFNRLITSKVSRWHFAPTELCRTNLIAERVNDVSITVTGNTVIDALHWVLNRIDTDRDLSGQLTQSLNQALPFNWQSDRFVLITGHRRENFGDGFMQICEALRILAFNFSGVHFIYPVHLNPSVQVPVRSILADISNVHLIDPLNYEPFVYLLKHCYLVLTDSGGIQEEAPSLGKPVLVMRDVTERPEALHSGTVELVGANKQRIVAGVKRLLEDEAHYLKMSYAHNPYGDGKACDRISAVLRNT
jgi:UDP-N-acetylglucosamine 2-epimerase (non-hydrolysing)